MRNRLQFSFWGMRLNAEGVIAIAAAPVIVLAVLTGGVQVLKIEDPVDKSDNFFARISVFPMGSRSFPVSAVSQPILTEGQTDGQIDCPPEGSQFFNGEPCYAQSTSVQLLGTASNRGRRLRDRGSTAHRVRVRSAADSLILKQVSNDSFR